MELEKPNKKKSPGLFAALFAPLDELEDDGSGAFTLNLSEAGNNPRIDRIVLTLQAENGMESEYELRYIAKEEIQRIGPRQLNT